MASPDSREIEDANEEGGIGHKRPIGENHSGAPASRLPLRVSSTQHPHPYRTSRLPSLAAHGFAVHRIPRARDSRPRGRSSAR
ncbi:hypothetical protein ACFQDD_08605, partial [Halorubrum pallidum]